MIFFLWVCVYTHLVYFDALPKKIQFNFLLGVCLTHVSFYLVVLFEASGVFFVIVQFDLFFVDMKRAATIAFESDDEFDEHKQSCDEKEQEWSKRQRVLDGDQEEKKHDNDGEWDPMYARARLEVYRGVKRKYETNDATISETMIAGINVNNWKSFFWPDSADVDTKLMFLKTVGRLSPSSSVQIIAKYLITLLSLNEPRNAAEMVEKMFANNPRAVDELIKHNLELCSLVQPQALQDTPFENYKFYHSLIMNLSYYHKENTRWALHMLLAKQVRAGGKEPMDPLYLPPFVDPPAESVSDTQLNNIKKKPHQLLLSFLFDCAGSKFLRRTQKSIYAPVMTASGHFTRFYTQLCDIKTWIRQQVTQKDYPLHYDTLTKDAKTLDYLEGHFGSQPDQRCPFLVVCRTLFSYESGVWDVDKKYFYPYLSSSITYGENIRSIADLDYDVSTANYFEGVPFDLRWMQPGFDWRTIPCEKIEKIFRDQGYNDEELSWVLMSHGRLMHDVGKKDQFQIAAHHKGPGGCGKSITAKVVKSIYPATFIGIINDDIEKNFPDGHLISSFLIMCMDVSPDFSLSTTRFLCWVSADTVSIKQKYKEQIAMQWTAPVTFFSNYDPPIQSAGGSNFRRFLIFPMERAIEKSDSTLEAEALKEAPFYVVKCTFAYHEKLELLGNRGLWDDRSILPERFWKARDEYAQGCSWPDAFLASGRFVYDPTFSLEEEDFKREYRFFLSTKKSLRNANRHSNKSNRAEDSAPPCAPIDFANALKSVRGGPCRWNVELKIIEGLKLNGIANIEGEQKTIDVPQFARRPRTITNEPNSSSSSFSSFGSPPDFPSFAQPHIQPIP